MWNLNSKAFLTIKYFFNWKSIQTYDKDRIALIIFFWDNNSWIYKKKMNLLEIVFYNHFPSWLLLVFCSDIFRNNCLIWLPYFIMKSIIIILVQVFMSLYPLVKIFITQSEINLLLLSVCLLNFILFK
jgi:hypothetical protein